MIKWKHGKRRGRPSVAYCASTLKEHYSEAGTDREDMQGEHMVAWLEGNPPGPNVFISCPTSCAGCFWEFTRIKSYRDPTVATVLLPSVS